jgi:hypothetical protein
MKLLVTDGIAIIGSHLVLYFEAEESLPVDLKEIVAWMQA